MVVFGYHPFVDAFRLIYRTLIVLVELSLFFPRLCCLCLIVWDNVGLIIFIVYYVFYDWLHWSYRFYWLLCLWFDIAISFRIVVVVVFEVFELIVIDILIIVFIVVVVTIVVVVAIVTIVENVFLIFVPVTW